MGWGVAVFIGKYMGWPRGGHGVAEFSVGVAMGWPTGWTSATPATPSTPKETSIVHSRRYLYSHGMLSLFSLPRIFPLWNFPILLHHGKEASLL